MGEGDLEQPLIDPETTKKLVGKTEEQKKEEEEKPQSSAFWTKFSLAMSMSFWVTLFYVPVVVPGVKKWFFDPQGMNLPDFFGSPDFASYWPNTVQLIVFTVYFSTGSTVNLAWQGLAGTIVAGINQFVMGKLFPVGGKCNKIGGPLVAGLRGFCEEYADPNYATYEWFVWFDVIFFLFAMLSSNAKENTMKFSMSWHITYMMAFMSPAGFKPSHAVNITSCIGVMLAILISLVPTKTASGFTLKQMVSNNLEGHPESIAKTVNAISRATVKFMLADKPSNEEERYHYKVNKTAIQMKVDSLSGMDESMSGDYNTSWWEGWIFLIKGGPAAVSTFTKIRTHCGIFAEAFSDDIGGFDDVAFVIKKVVTAMDAVDYKLIDKHDLAEVDQERQHMRRLLEDLNGASMGLLMEISSWKNASQNLDVFTAKVKEMQKANNAKFDALHNAYNKWVKESPVANKSQARQTLRTNMGMFVFSILQLSKEVVDLSDKVVEKYEAEKKNTSMNRVKGLVRDTWAEFISTYFSGAKAKATGFFLLKAFTDKGKRSFVFRNLISIGLCFVMGNLLQGNVFQAPAFNPMMASTLAVLLSHFPGSAFYKNLMRLLGLAIGNALPVVMLAVVTMFPPLLEPYVHLLVFFLFTLYFCLMYYTSPEWSYVGCVVAGFGCYSFTTDTWSNASFDAAYCKIGQFTAAICVQILVDAVDTTIRNQYPQDVVVANMKKMTDGVRNVFQRFEEHVALPTADPNIIEDIKTQAGALKAIMADQETMVSECQPKTTMIAGPRPAFKLQLYMGALAAMKELLGEIDALCLMDEFSAKVGRNHDQWFVQGYKAFYDQVMRAMTKTFATLMTILEKTDESLLKTADVDKVSLIDDDTTGHSDSIRMSVLKRIIADTLAHVVEIEHLCCSSGSMEFKVD